MLTESWDARIQRAEQLAAAGEATRDLLAFYGTLLRAQKRVYEYLRSSRGWLPSGLLEQDEDVGFFNGGQKLYFWAIAASAVLFLITGLLLWFDDTVPRWSVAAATGRDPSEDYGRERRRLVERESADEAWGRGRDERARGVEAGPRELS